MIDGRVWITVSRVGLLAAMLAILGQFSVAYGWDLRVTLRAKVFGSSSDCPASGALVTCGKLEFIGASRGEGQPNWDDVDVQSLADGRVTVDLPQGWTGTIRGYAFCAGSQIQSYQIADDCYPVFESSGFPFTMPNSDAEIKLWIAEADKVLLHGQIRDCAMQSVFGATVTGTGACGPATAVAPPPGSDWGLEVPCGWAGSISCQTEGMNFNGYTLNDVTGGSQYDFVGTYRNPPPPPTPHVQLPTETTSIAIGEQLWIHWVVGPIVTQSTIELSRDNGPFVQIATVSGGGADAYWQVTGPTSDNCRIKVITTHPSGCYSQTTSQHVSPSFRIVDRLEVTAPTAGVTWQPTTQQSITWDACSNCGFTAFDVAISRDGMSNWLVVAEDLPASARSFTWTVTGPATTDVRAMVRAIKNATEGTTVISPGFTIDCFTAAMTQPIGGGSKPKTIGSGLNFAAAPVGTPCAPITYQYLFSRDGGASYTPVGLNTHGQFNWTITGPPSSNCKAMIKAWNEHEPIAQEMISASFAIANPPPPLPEQSAASVPLKTRLLGSAPNPFRPSTTINFELATPARTSIEIIDVAGHRVRTVDLGLREPARSSWTWDGRDEGGRTVGRGIYYVRFRANDFVDRMRITKLE